MIKYSKKKGFMPAHSSRIQPDMAGESRPGEPEAAGPITATARKRRLINTCCGQHLFSRIQARERHHPPWAALHTSVKSGCPDRHAQRLVSLRLTINTNHDTTWPCSTQGRIRSVPTPTPHAHVTTVPWSWSQRLRGDGCFHTV